RRRGGRRDAAQAGGQQLGPRSHLRRRRGPRPRRGPGRRSRRLLRPHRGRPAGHGLPARQGRPDPLRTAVPGPVRGHHGGQGRPADRAGRRPARRPPGRGRGERRTPGTRGGPGTRRRGHGRRVLRQLPGPNRPSRPSRPDRLNRPRPPTRTTETEEFTVSKPPLPAEAVDLLRRANPCVMATLRSDGSPVSTATWYLWEDGRVLLNLDEGRVRLKHLRRDPRVTLTVLAEDDWYTHVTLIGRVAEMRDD